MRGKFIICPPTYLFVYLLLLTVSNRDPLAAPSSLPSAAPQTEIAPVLGAALQGAVGVLATVAQNPRNPSFNHSLFETIACLVKNSCEAGAAAGAAGAAATTPAAVAQFEQFLFPHFQTVLGMENCDEFAPYVFQVRAQWLR